MITGFLEPSKGAVEIMGQNISEKPVEIKRMIGYVPEGAPLYGEMTAIGFLEFISRIRGFSRKQREVKINNIIKLLNLEDVLLQKIETFSKGFKRRIGLAQALIHDPELLVLDEPTDGLDPNQKNEVRKLITKLGANKAIIISTHILEEVSAICNRAMIISNGKLLMDDKPSKILSKSKTHGVISISVKGLKNKDLKKNIDKLDSVKEVLLNKGCCLVIPLSATRAKDEVANLIKKKSWVIEHFNIEKGSLEEIFRTYTKN